jgi:hypothetical protein
MDRNPRYREDARFQASALRVADLLWETCGTNFSEFPSSYLATLRHEYADGKVSMCELIDRVDLGPGATYEDYREVFDSLLYTEADRYPDPDSVVELRTADLGLETQDFAEAFSFAEEGEEMSHNVEKFLKKVISSVYTDGVTDVSDAEGNPPGEENNYLLSPGGEEFQGVFHDRGSDGTMKEFPFRIANEGGKWQIEY